MIHEDIVLTAAHCVTSLRPGGQLAVGASDRTSSTADGKEFRTIEETVQHPKYRNFPSDGYDYMVIKLMEPSTKTPITMNADNVYPPEDSSILLTALGFGSTSVLNLTNPQPTVPLDLQQVQLPFVDQVSCNQSWMMDPVIPQEITRDIMLCAGGNGTGGKCQRSGLRCDWSGCCLILTLPHCQYRPSDTAISHLRWR